MFYVHVAKTNTIGEYELKVMGQTPTAHAQRDGFVDVIEYGEVLVNGLKSLKKKS